ncbi:MAG: 50S ribosomal protein L11 methyltransferase [Leptospirales bacterium]
MSSNRSYRIFKAGCPSSRSDGLSEWLARATGQPVVEELHRGRSVLSVSVDQLEEISMLLLSEGVRSLGGEVFPEELISGGDWETLWKEQGFQSFRVNGWLAVVPEWETDPISPGPIIRIHPHLAFGTGLHETTGKCLSLLADHVPRPGRRGAILDFGSGTGILGIAALSLGYGDRLFSVDNDPLAVEATRANLDLNGLSEMACVFDQFDPLFRTIQDQNILFPLILANVTGGVIARFLPEWYGLLAPGGMLILSGIATRELDRILALCPPPVSVHRGRRFHSLLVRRVS